MKWKYFLSLVALLMSTTAALAQDGMSYERYRSDDGRISFDVPEGWLIAPYGPAFSLSTQGYVETADVQPGQQQIDIMLLNADDLETAGVAKDLALEDYTVALLSTLSDGSPIPSLDSTRTTTLDNGVEGFVIDLSIDPAQVVVTVYRQGDATILVSGFAHKSEFELFEPIALHVLNSIELGENAAQAPTMSPIPTVNVRATDDEIQLPPVPNEGVEAGMYTFEFANNRTETSYSPDIARLKDGVTMDDFNEALATGDGFGAVSLVTLLGGPIIMPGQTIPMTVELVPGDYMFMELAEDGPGEMIPFSVVESDMMQGLKAPEADVTLTMVDFAYDVPDIIPSGDLLWHIVNSGEQWHEAVIFSVPEGTTVDGMLSGDESGGDGSDEYGQVFTWSPMSEGTEAWATINLEPGTYAVLCFLPDLNGDFASHSEHGMVQIFTVE